VKLKIREITHNLSALLVSGPFPIAFLISASVTTMPGAAMRNSSISSAQRQSLGWALGAVCFFFMHLMPDGALAGTKVVVMEEEAEEREFVVVSSEVRSISGMGRTAE
jgi:hypothetical protein